MSGAGETRQEPGTRQPGEGSEEAGRRLWEEAGREAGRRLLEAAGDVDFGAEIGGFHSGKREKPINEKNRTDTNGCERKKVVGGRGRGGGTVEGLSFSQPCDPHKGGRAGRLGGGWEDAAGDVDFGPKSVDFIRGKEAGRRLWEEAGREAGRRLLETSILEPKSVDFIRGKEAGRRL